LLAHPEIILQDAERTEQFETFIIRLKKCAKSDFESLLRKQSVILNWYLQAGIINEKSTYVLTKDQVLKSFD